MTVYPKSLTTPQIDEVTEVLLAQLMSVMGFKHRNWTTRLLSLVLRSPAQTLSRLVVDLDRDIAQTGWNAAVNKFQAYFVKDVLLTGEKNIPAEGPLMVVSNHPAAYDIVVLLNAIHRQDLKLLHSDIALLQMFPNISSHGIPVPYHIPYRLQTVRSTIQHLKNNGCIFIFPRGNVEPDPTVSPGARASLIGWSSSIELFLRRVPETKTIVAIASGMLSGKWFNHPLIKQWKKYEQRQKVAEIFQIATQFLLNRKPTAIPRVIFSEQLSIADLGGQDAPTGALLDAITAQARHLLADHPLQ